MTGLVRRSGRGPGPPGRHRDRPTVRSGRGRTAVIASNRDVLGLTAGAARPEFQAFSK